MKMLSYTQHVAASAVTCGHLVLSLQAGLPAQVFSAGRAELLLCSMAAVSYPSMSPCWVIISTGSMILEG